MWSDPEQGQSEPSEFFQPFCKHYATPTLATSRCLHTSTTSSVTPHTHICDRSSMTTVKHLTPSKLIMKALTFRFQAVHIGDTNTGVPQGCVLSPPFYSFIQTLLCGHAHLCHLHRLSGPSHSSQDLTWMHQTHITTETATQRLVFPHRLRRHGLQDPLRRVS